MFEVTHKRAWLAAAAAVAIALPLATTHHATAQTAIDGSVPCPPAAAQALSPDQFQAQAQQEQTAFAQQLAQALSLPAATVQQALQAQTTNSLTMLTPPAAPPDPISGAAQQLGVTADKLAAAVHAADATLPCSFPGTQAGGQEIGIFLGSGQPPSGGPSIDTTAFFAAVAQNLGGSFTGPQVEAAFQASAPTPPDPSQIVSQIQSRLNDLAGALGVGSSALMTALHTIGASGACLPPGVLGGQVTVRTGAASAPPSFGDGPILIPLAKATGEARPLGSLEQQFGIKPCGLVVIQNSGG